MKASRATADALVNALMADLAQQVQLARDDFRRSLLVQPTLADHLRESVENRTAEVLTAFQQSEKTLMAAGAYIRGAQVDISRDYKAMADRVASSCMEAAEKGSFAAVKAGVQREVTAKWLLIGSLLGGAIGAIVGAAVTATVFLLAGGK